MLRCALVILLIAGCAHAPVARTTKQPDAFMVATHLTMAVHYHMQHGRVAQETWDTTEALQRGTGLCSQQAITLYGLLDMFGIKGRVMGLDGHVICLAWVEGKWIVCDPDYGVVVPIAIEELEENPALVLPYYGREMPVFDKKGNHFYN